MIEHLRSSGQQDILQELEHWQRLGGICIEKCHLLLEDIAERARAATGLEVIFHDSTQPHQPGLWDGFVRSVYVLALSTPVESTYVPDVSIAGSLSLLAVAGRFETDWSFTLAWVPSAQQAQVQATHERLIEDRRRSDYVRQIDVLAGQIARTSNVLSNELTQFSSQPRIPGRCSHCPE